MSKKALQEFLTRLDSDKPLQAELREMAVGEGDAAGVPAQKLVSLAKGKGYAFSVEEVRDEGLELSDVDLEQVSGGITLAGMDKWTTIVPLSSFKFTTTLKW